jgi:hypothetical protein
LRNPNSLLRPDAWETLILDDVVTLASRASRAKERERERERAREIGGGILILSICRPCRSVTYCSTVSFCDFFLVSSSEKVLNCNLVHCEVCLEEGHLLLGEKTQQRQDNSV